jgi:hypothetical protein
MIMIMKNTNNFLIFRIQVLAIQPVLPAIEPVVPATRAMPAHSRMSAVDVNSKRATTATVKLGGEVRTGELLNEWRQHRNSEKRNER